DGQRINLSVKEFELLLYFAKNLQKVLSREMILEAVWDSNFDGDDRTVDTHVKLLRQSLGSKREYIKTLRGVGYKFEADI
ncbi:MAG: winged helix-turn-helix transcriptional regulator, partial [Erysipelothrix sp.]|nr:winged helix-turn-helix transcriptional regulator [Erysipelothrix sp.]